MEEELHGVNNAGVKVSIFDYSVENHFKAVDAILKLFGEAENFSAEECEIQRLYNSVTFLSKDFVFYVGGPVWALDWCPRIHKRPDFPIKNEFIAVSAHPPGSTYHKIGAPLNGRGMIQIWCILNISVSEKAKEDKPTDTKKSRGRPRKKPVNEDENEAAKEDKPTDTKKPIRRPRKKSVNEDENNLSTQPKRPRGRPRKYPRDESIDSINCNSQLVQALAVQYPEGTSEFLAIEGASVNTLEDYVRENNGKRQNSSILTVSACDSNLKNSMQKKRLKKKARSSNIGGDASQPLLTKNEDKVSSATDYQIDETSGKDTVPVVSNNVSDNSFTGIGSADCSIPDDVALPRIVLCLAHDGKVAWDVKWRPLKESDSRCMHRMGYLAALLGNGSLQVWDVPLPHAMTSIYSSSYKEGMDPRFIKLEPVFKCSMVKSGGIQSIPLAVEWSTSSLQDYLLAGCHDGTVALWKFSADGLSGDAKPLLCFSADTVPIRAVAWAPVGSDPEGANVILTAGHGGMKFWDIRDPFRPLWDVHPAPRFIYSLDWLPDPRCVILSLDDGTMRLLSLVKSAYDVPVHGKLTVGPKQLGLHTFNCSSFAIWNVQVSRLTAHT